MQTWSSTSQPSNMTTGGIGRPAKACSSESLLSNLTFFIAPIVPQRATAQRLDLFHLPLAFRKRPRARPERGLDGHIGSRSGSAHPKRRQNNRRQPTLLHGNFSIPPHDCDRSLNCASELQLQVGATVAETCPNYGSFSRVSSKPPKAIRYRYPTASSPQPCPMAQTAMCALMHVSRRSWKAS